MELRVVLPVLLVLLLGSVERSACVRCFANFNLNTGSCEQEIGDVTQDDCCQSPKYGYLGTDGECHFCGPPVWSPWSPWLHCNILCGDGVSQRSRKCFGIGECEDVEKILNLQTVPCNSTCCDAKGWNPWREWSPCSVTCGEGGVRRRERTCSGPPECQSACSGDSNQSEECPPRTCPVHGSWSKWSMWSVCSGTCVGGTQPTRQRQRTCTDPAPSVDPPGNSCPGDSVQSQHCSDLPNCPLDGNWGAWSRPQPCSVSCGEGLQLSSRSCDQPAPRYGGRLCPGPSTQASVCQRPCPVDGLWTGWSSWGDCSSSCIQGGQSNTRNRHRSCSNPAPSSSPPGSGCHGDNSHSAECNHLPHCPVDGAWGSWSPYSACSVTCGVGVQVSTRQCDSPTPQHSGKQCAGDGRRTIICRSNVFCPVDGVWEQWSLWSECKSPFSTKPITCKKLGGSQARERRCLHQDHNGSICDGDNQREIRVCYDVTNCYVPGLRWKGWAPWGYCRPSCTGSSRRIRQRICEPDFSGYRPIGVQKLPPNFHGTPNIDCGDLPEGENKFEVEMCRNMPTC